jgi:putative DNA primase/helicase
MAQRKKYAQLDLGNAERFADAFENLLLYDHLQKKWYHFNGGIWEMDEDGLVMRNAGGLIKKCYELTSSGKQRTVFEKSHTQQKLHAMVSLAASDSKLANKGRDWNKYPMLLPCLNGAIDLESGKLIQTTPTHMLNMRISIAYDAAAPKPERWLRFMEETWPDYEVRDFIHRAVGYSLSGNVREQCYFALFGEGSNGKSTFFRIVNAVLRDFGHTIKFTALEHNKRGGLTNDIVELSAKRFVVASETNENVQLNEGLVKALTGDDDISARQLYERNIVFRPEMKLWLGFNHKPVITDQTPGFWRRTRLIEMPMRYSINDGQDGLPLPDKSLNIALMQELPGILKWMVEGCLEWQSRGLSAPDSVREATERYQSENHPLSDFLESNYVVEQDHWVAVDDVYRRYLDYCKVYHLRPVFRQEFRKLTDSIGLVRYRATRNKIPAYRHLSPLESSLEATGFEVETDDDTAIH